MLKKTKNNWRKRSESSNIGISKNLKIKKVVTKTKIKKYNEVKILRFFVVR